MSTLSGKYRLGRLIGGGGMAEVVEAEVVGAQGFSRRVAIKRILGPLTADARFSEMFANEARLASLLHHPNVVSVLDFDADESGGHYLVMELVRGVDLRQLADTGRIPVAVSVHIVCEVLRGLAYAHELVEGGKHLAIVHRDVSPHNVMLAWSGAVKLVDFGIAKAVAATDASKSGSLKGKVAYMSPEQAHGREIDGRTDVFATGVVLHELLTGERLFRGATEPEVLARLLTMPIPRPSQVVSDVPPVVDAAVMQMLEREPDERIPSARLALEALLASGASRNRSREDLRELLRTRFAEKAPAEADLSGPLASRQATPPGPVPRPVFSPPTSGNPVPRPIGVTTTPLGRPASAPTPILPSPDPRPTRQPRRSRPAHGWPLLLAGAALAAVAALTIGLLWDPPPATDRPALSSAKPIDDDPKPDPAPARADAAPVAADASSPEPSTEPEPPPARPRPPAEPGSLRIIVEPWAMVTVDGQSLGQTPVVLGKRRPGRYRVRLVNPDLGKSETVRVEVRPGKETVVRRKWGAVF